MKRKSTFAERIFDTLFGNTQYPQLDFNKVNDQFVDYGKNEILILYGKTAYKIKVERIPGYHDNLTTI